MTDSQSRHQSRGFWAEAWARFRRKPLAMAALVFVTLLVSDVYWGVAPIGFLKFPLPLLR